MTILLTGASGLVGSAIMKLYPHKVTPIRSSDFDIRDYSQVCKMFEKFPNACGVIHLAANVGGLFKNMKYPVEMFEDNILMNTNVLRSAHAYGIQKVVCCLSTCIYPDGIAIDENSLHSGPPHESNEGYAYAKRMMEVQCRLYRKQYGRDYICVTPTNVYGPCDNFNIENAHVVPALIRKFCESSVVHVRGDGSALRQFIYSEDLAKIIMWAYENNKSVFACPFKEVSIIDLVAIICEEAGFKGEIIFDLDKQSNGQYKKTVKACWPLYETATELRDGIRKTIEWYRSQPSHSQAVRM